MTTCYTLNSTAKDVVQANTNLSISELTDLIHGLNVQEKRKASIKIDHNKEESHRVVCGVGIVKEKPKTKDEIKREEINEWIFTTKVNTGYDIDKAANEYIRKHPRKF